MRGHPVAVGVAVLRRQLVAVRGGELPHDAGVDQHLQSRGQPKHVRHHPAGLVLVDELDDVHLAVGAGEAHLDSIFRLECQSERPYDLIDDEVGVIGELALLLRLGDQLGADVGGLG